MDALSARLVAAAVTAVGGCCLAATTAAYYDHRCRGCQTRSHTVRSLCFKRIL